MKVSAIVSMIQIPLETFSYTSQSDCVNLGGATVRSSKWNPDSVYGRFTR